MGVAILSAMNSPLAPDNPQVRRRVGIWLAIWAVMLLLIVVIGGVTRLTESGLSITEWKPVSGIVPPLSHADWEAEFARYRQIPEYQQLKQGHEPGRLSTDLSSSSTSTACGPGSSGWLSPCRSWFSWSGVDSAGASAAACWGSSS